MNGVEIGAILLTEATPSTSRSTCQVRSVPSKTGLPVFMADTNTRCKPRLSPELHPRSAGGRPPAHRESELYSHINTEWIDR